MEHLSFTFNVWDLLKFFICNVEIKEVVLNSGTSTQFRLLYILTTNCLVVRINGKRIKRSHRICAIPKVGSEFIEIKARGLFTTKIIMLEAVPNKVEIEILNFSPKINFEITHSTKKNVQSNKGTLTGHSKLLGKHKSEFCMKLNSIQSINSTPILMPTPIVLFPNNKSLRQINDQYGKIDIPAS